MRSLFLFYRSSSGFLVDVLLGLLIASGDTIPKLPRLEWTIGLSECLLSNLYNMLLLRYFQENRALLNVYKDFES